MASQHNRTPGRVVCRAARGGAGTVELATFLARRLGHYVTVQEDGRSEALLGDPLGPDTRLVVVSIAGIPRETVLETICISPCPVLAVPALAAEVWARPSRALRAFERVVVCGVDGSQPARSAAGFAARVASVCAARLLIAHVRPEVGPGAPVWSEDEDVLRAGEFEQDLRLVGEAISEARKSFCAPEFRQRRGSVAASLSALAADESAILIAIGSDGHDPDQLVMSGSNTAELLEEGSRPVLIIPPWTRTQRNHLHGGINGVRSSSAA